MSKNSTAKRRRRRARLRERRMLTERVLQRRREKRALDPVVVDRKRLQDEIAEETVRHLRERGVAVIDGECVSTRSASCVVKRPRSAATRDVRNSTALGGMFRNFVTVAPIQPGESVEQWCEHRKPQVFDEPPTIFDAVGGSPRRIPVHALGRDDDGNPTVVTTSEFISSSSHVDRVQDNGRDSRCAPLGHGESVPGLRGTIPKRMCAVKKS